MKKKKKSAAEKAAHEYNLEQARKLIESSGYVLLPGTKDQYVTPAALGKLGGKARAKNLDKKALSAIGKLGAAKRWAKNPGEKGGRS